MKFLIITIFTLLIFFIPLESRGIERPLDLHDLEELIILNTTDGKIVVNSTKLYEKWLPESELSTTVSLLSHQDAIVLRDKVNRSCDSILDNYETFDSQDKQMILENWTKCANGEIESDFLTSKLADLVKELRDDNKKLRNELEVFSDKLDLAEQQRNDATLWGIVSTIGVGFVSFILTRKWDQRIIKK